MRSIVAGVGFGEQHLRWLSECSGADIVGLYVRTRTANADEIAERFGVEHVSTDLPGLIAASRADALVVTTPPRSHAALLHAALEAGLVAISDKPLTADVASARALAIATQHATGRGIVTFQWRQHPGVRYLRMCMHRKLLGPVSHLELRFDHDFRAKGDGTPWRHDAALAGAGTLGDQGVHLFDLLRHITADEWTVLTAHGLRLWPERTFGAESIACETEDVADVVLRSASGGQTAFVHASRVAIGIRALQIRIFGTTGSVDLVVHPDTGTGSLRHISVVDGETHSESFETPSLNPYAALLCEHSNIAGDVASFADGLAAQVLLNRSVELMNYTSNLEVS